MIVSAHNEWLVDSEGREYVDLCAGYGSVWLGHANAGIQSAIAAQLARYAAPGYLPEPALPAARTALARFLPQGYSLGGLYSTGMEAVETALRVAWAHSGRLDVASFEGSTHGRSFVTAAMGSHSDVRSAPFVHRLPPFSSGADAAGHFIELTRRVQLAAIVIEPVQMTGGGFAIPAAQLARLCEHARREGVVTILDETLTGLYRCGRRYYHEPDTRPDLLLLGKGLGNGFPVSALILADGMTFDRRVKPGSTYWNHPLACAAVAATLRELERLPPPSETAARIGSVIGAALGHLDLHGCGAMWCLGVPGAGSLQSFAMRLHERGIVVSYYDRYIRLLPPLTIDMECLARTCHVIACIHADTFR